MREIRVLSLLVVATLAGFVVLTPGMATAGKRATRQAPRPTQEAFPDFNGDGYADLAIGDVFETVPTEDGADTVAAGAEAVMYGSSTGIQATGAGAPDDQFWYQSAPGVKDKPEAGDNFGFVSVAGDFNGDGFEDLAIGVELEWVRDVQFGGAVEVLYGSTTGLQASGAGGPDDQFWTQDTAGVLDQAETRDGFGRALAAADFNGDGYVDLAIGVRGEGSPGVPFAGATNVLYGSATGLQADGVGGPDDQFWLQGHDGLLDKAESHDYFGRSMTAGDFNGDGYGDLAAGAYDEDVQGVKDAGSVSVIYGSPTGLQATGAGGPDDQFWTQGSNGMQDQAESGDVFGRSFAAGDYNGDGYEDLAVGPRREDVGTVPEAGAVNVLYGSATGLQATGTGGPDDQFWSQGSDGVEDLAQPYDWMGNSITAGDFNGDGFDDLSIGARQEDVAGVNQAGAVGILFGSATGLQATGTGGPDDQFWTQGSDGLPDQPDPDDEFGFAFWAGDFNTDGFTDLEIGVPLEDFEAKPARDSGQVHVLYGSAAGLQTDGVGGPDDQVWIQGQDGVEDDVDGHEAFGWSSE